MTQEIELKYAIEDLSPAEIKTAIKEIGAKINSETAVHQKTVYFDTARLRLRNFGFELRIRDDGKGFKQTMKIPNNTASIAFDRTEVNKALKSMKPDVDMVIPYLKQVGLRKLEGLELTPVFTSVVDRHSFKIKFRDSKISIDIDKGKINPNRRKTGLHNLCELELELEKGKLDDVLVFASLLNEQINLRHCGYGKADFGYALTAPRYALKPLKIKAIMANRTSNGSMKDMLSAAIDHFVKNDPFVLKNKLEAIHQSRVAIRRIRAILRAHKRRLDYLDRKGLNGELKWAQVKLGEARDWQVFQAEVLKDITDKYNSDLSELEKFVAGQTRKHLAEALDVYAGKRMSRLVCKLQEWTMRQPDVPMPDEKARQKVLLRDLKAMMAESRLPALAYPSKIHAIRIRFKKLRYMLELTEPDKDSDLHRFATEAKKMQDSLGKFNDYAKALELLSAARSEAVSVRVHNQFRHLIENETLVIYDNIRTGYMRTRRVARQIDLEQLT